ncbi:hypothetical protein ABE321_15955 [Bacillus paralicheniformis]|uniref:hypothetical protein n=1 Tax=Bacillus paralicheniformis TaxID=1648923 RepID=UPI0021BD56CC|nr:hypothetical protein [Bacillus paralicheniformis]MEC1824088.1 hypothetical protein [Bacillus paralicheniformis]
MCDCFQCNMTEEEFDAGFENYIERERLIEKARSFHVPGHGPDFENMTNEQIEDHIKFIEKTFEMAFAEDDEGEDEDV